MRRRYSAGIAVATAVLVTGTGVTNAAATDAGPPAARVAVASPAQPSAQLPSQAQIAALFDKWNAALATGDPNRVANLYAPDAVLLPTVSDIRIGRAGIVDYFRTFLLSKPVGRIQQRVITVLGPTAAVDSGLYQFTLTDQNGTKSTVDARYTFVYELRGGSWLIVSHHSSKVPTG
ncbi:SgcJ/EcaC family oxidoreductase [Kitasatospora sp. HPMI-4]|uniref:SgcJ/EcaC family oxidoreductase n=1 Tax=Kitasatospora sp. HPMI-4 TaxID=3448443 RepID=UPI003F1DB76F